MLHYSLRANTSYRPESGETICPRRWQFDSWRIYVRPRTGSQSAHGQAAGSQRAYSLGQLRHGTDRRTEGSRYHLMPLNLMNDENLAVSYKKILTFFSSNSDIRRWILIIFGKNVYPK